MAEHPIQETSNTTTSNTKSKPGNDKMSSPNQTAALKQPHTPMQTSRETPDVALLVIRQQPTHVFPGETFEIEFALEMSPKTDNSPPTSLEVRVELVGPSRDASLVVMEEPRYSASRQTGKLKCGLVVSESSKLGEGYSLRLETKQNLGVQGVVTDAIVVVGAKLQVQTSAEWSNVWYKDEGGREKSMEVAITAKDSHDQIVRESNQIELNVQLCYEVPGGQPVPVMNQEILRVLGAGRSQQLNKQTGQAKIRYRVEDVSKNHQGQNFLLEISAKGRNDIAPCFTPPVAIRSKRNKRHRSALSIGPGPAASMSYAERAGLEDLDTARVREAIESVVRWSEEVVNGIYPLQWTVMGYAQNPDGSYDYNRPYHNMQNPNPFISHILSTYNDSTREHIHFLKRSFEQTPSASIFDSMAGSMQRKTFLPSMMPPMFQAGPPSAQLAAASGLPAALTSPRELPTTLPAALQHLASDRMPKSDFGYYPGPSTAAASLESPFPSSHLPQQRAPAGTRASPLERDEDVYSDEANVEYVLAKQFKAFQTGEKLGFPAYSASKELLGFYRESDTRVGVRHFVPIRQHAAYFSHAELRQATEILEQAMAQKSKAVHAMKDWGSMASLLDHALVYDWSKDIGGSNASGNNQSSAGSGDL